MHQEEGNSKKEIRKLQVTTGGTYILTIPKEWVDSMGVGRGSPLAMVLENSEISIVPEDQRSARESRTIDADTLKNRKFLELSIVASYIQGHDITQVSSSSGKRHEWKKWAKEAVSEIMGVEIFEEYSDRILLQNLVDPYKFDLMRMLEQFSANAAAVLTDAVSSLATGNREIAEDAFERGSDLTRNYRLLMRLVMLASREKGLRMKYGIGSGSSLIVTAIAVREMGRIAYYSMRTAQHVLEIGEAQRGKIPQMVSRMEKITRDMQRKAFYSLITRNMGAASQVIDSMTQVRNIYEEIHRSGEFPGLRNQISWEMIVRDIRAVAGYAVALADDAILGMFS